MATAGPCEASEDALELGREIGSGAIASVIEIIHRPSGDRFAAKRLHPRHERDAGARARFQREAELARALQHENIVRVFGVRMLAERTALLMELVEGPTLATRIAQAGTLPSSAVVSIGRGIASGLAYAHAHGVIHRDLKPANVLLTADEAPIAKIADFGMARAASFANADRRALTVLGTPPYMAPECLDPLAVDPRTDLYALGCILYEMATGEPPFGGPTPYAVLEAHRSAPIPALPAEYGVELNALVSRLLAKAPGERPQTAGTVADELGRIERPRALVATEHLPTSIAATAQGRCARCSGELLPELRICFRCGMTQVYVEPGPYTVVVIGPGKISHKFSAELRDTLVQWVDANAAAGLDASSLRKYIPRLAFPLATRVSQISARTFVDSLRHLGIEAQLWRGGPAAHPGTRAAARSLLARGMSLVAAIFALPVIINPFLGVITLAGVLLGLPIVFFASRRSAFHPVLSLSPPQSRGVVPPAMQHRLNALYGVVGTIRERRHREALRAVVHRTVRLTRALPSEDRQDVDKEMAHAINLAAVAAQRMDELDIHMGRADFDPANPSHRASMRERDMWSARLLDLTATLDALAARRAAAQHAVDDGEEAQLLASLRTTVESLEEVQRL